MKSVGIIGFGSFGEYLSGLLSKGFKVKAYDKNVEVTEKFSSSLEESINCDFLILAIPYSSYDKVLKQIKNIVPTNTVIIDICSVKVRPTAKLKNILPNQPYISIHPLFGPESAPQSIAGQTVVFCESNTSLQTDFKAFLKHVGIKVVDMSAEEHDKEMAVLQGITFFLAKGLNEFGLHQMKLKTPSFQKLLDLAYLDNHHSEALLQTIFEDNSFSLAKRDELIKALEKLKNKY